jgi:hypothetical protein
MTFDRATHRWWTLLRAGSALNLVLLLATAALVPLDTPARQIQLGCAAVYVAVCAFRSFYPRVDLERTVLIDHPLSGIALGRTAATVAELAFVVQCALFVADLAPSAGAPWMSAVAGLLVPVIVVAEVCCWLGVLTLNHGWHAAEETLWALAVGLLGAAFVAAWPAAEGALSIALPVGLLGCAVAVFVMLGLDVPMYLRLSRASAAAGGPRLGVAEGLADALSRREPTGAWAVWRREVAWMTPYFTAGVWLSLALVWL